MAVGGVGLALIAFLIAGAVIGASGHAKEMVAEYWTIGASLAGALVGIIAPSPRQKKEAAATQSHNPKGGYGATVAQPVLLIAALGATLWLATEVNAADAALLRTLAAGSAGALIGLLVPSPGSDLKQ